MRGPGNQRQHGYVLLLTLLVFMGIGGVVLAGFTQQARQELVDRKYQHNQRVLNEAKQALLMFAYNYPQSNGGGPGRLPCPDHDNNGTVDFPLNCTDVGRFPWADPRLDTPELRDASGETLWYAVSNSFDNFNGGGVINSDTEGNITLLDRNGQILYDGRAAGLAAVIIAPGERLRRDVDDNVASVPDGIYDYVQLRNTDAQRENPVNYLDTYTIIDTVPDPDVIVATYDNRRFTNNEFNSDDDPFIMGPIFDPLQGDYVVNDQMVIITADEVIEMAEKAVLETYRDAIEDYRSRFPGAPNPNPYPWLSGYDVTQNLNLYDARPGTTTGRVPFLDYFVDEASPHTVITDLRVDFDITLTYTSMADNGDPFNPAYIDVFSPLFTGFPVGAQWISITRANLSFSDLDFVGGDTANNGTMIVRDGAPINLSWNPVTDSTIRRYFWDGTGSPLLTDGWELCPVNAGDGTDCAKDIDPPYNFESYDTINGWASHADIMIRLVELRLTADPDFVVELNYTGPAPVIANPVAPDAAANATFSATFNAAQVPAMSIADSVETSTRNFIELEVVTCDQDNFVGTGLNLYDLGNEDGGTILCTADLATNLVAVAGFVLNNNFAITADWYPQLPRWVADNNWDDAMMLSYAPDFAPDGDGFCTPEDGDTGSGAADDCLVVSNRPGPAPNNNINALLVLAGEHDLVDGDDLNGDGDWADPNEVIWDNRFDNDLYDIFEPENYSGIGNDPTPNNDPTPASDTELPRVFDRREQVVPGNAADTVFVLN